DDGEIAAVLVDEEATLKRVYLSPDSVTLVSENPKYKPMVYTKNQGSSIRILGKAVSFTTRL
ncbi:MAG: repressor LexA, partial [Clostridia bacterium]|nr:repressor LexA [Clostridia bacterium]